MSLREQVIQRVYDECADFAERNGISDTASCAIAAAIGEGLRRIDRTEMWETGLWPVWSATPTSLFMDYTFLEPERLIEYRS